MPELFSCFVLAVGLSRHRHKSRASVSRGTSIHHLIFKEWVRDCDTCKLRFCRVFETLQIFNSAALYIYIYIYVHIYIDEI